MQAGDSGRDTVELTEREVLELKTRQVQAEIARLRQIGDEPDSTAQI